MYVCIRIKSDNDNENGDEHKCDIPTPKVPVPLIGNYRIICLEWHDNEEELRVSFSGLVSCNK